MLREIEYKGKCLVIFICKKIQTPSSDNLITNKPSQRQQLANTYCVLHTWSFIVSSEASDLCLETFVSCYPDQF
jgi:hypothetical protein